MGKFAVMVKDAQGQELQCGSAKKAISQAARLLDCPKERIQVINAWNLGGPCYLFDSADADASFWLNALRLDGEPAYVGPPAL